jgi:D-sedoheptulose 7-phosphate isomerase
VGFSKNFLLETVDIISRINTEILDNIIGELQSLRENKGRLFICGVGGSAGHASHAVNDFRKIAGIEAYSPTDNISEVTARTNDEGWETVFEQYLRVSQLSHRDALLIISVGGGCENPPVSANLVAAIKFAKSVNSKVFGIVGRDGGYTSAHGDHVLIVPMGNPESITPQTEGVAAILWHLMVSHPKLKLNKTKW